MKTTRESRPIALRCLAVLGTVGILAGPAEAGFEWGKTKSSGAGTFVQQIERKAIVEVGEIPAGLSGISIRLLCETDVDVQLYDKASGTKIVGWPDGMLRGRTRATASYRGMSVTYSGYLGDGTGSGNPENPGGYKTSYLWERVWQRDSFMDILARFIHLEVEERRPGGRLVRREKMIFPRYHQLDVVRKLVADARQEGVGKNYLVQHSAGSGKSNSIAWMAHRLASLHNDQDEKVFDSIIVVTSLLIFCFIFFSIEHANAIILSDTSPMNVEFEIGLELR